MNLTNFNEPCSLARQKLDKIFTFDNTYHLGDILMKRSLVILFLFYAFFCSLLHAQESNKRKTDEKTKELVQLTGRLENEKNQPLPFAHVLVLNNYRGTITDNDGKFSFVAQIGDSIMFSTLGYKRQIKVIPDTLKQPYMVLDLKLQVDTFMISQVVVYPWKNYEEFKEAFLNLKLPEDDMQRAKKNIALIRTQIIMDETPNAQANFQQIYNQQFQEMSSRGQYPSYQIFNAFAWADFFKALKRGDFKKYSKRSNE